MGPTRNPLLKLFGINVLVGIFVSVMLVTFLFAFDIAHLRTLIEASSDRMLAIGMLLFGFTITLSSSAIGSAIMLLPGDEGGPRGGRRARETEWPADGTLQRVMVRAPARRLPPR